MENNCYTGTNIEQIEDGCGNNFISTSCVQTPNAISYLDLEAGSNQTEVNAALVAALTYKDQQISEIIVDGSDTKIEAGDNIGITGVGTEANPYMISSPLQDLQNTLDAGNYADVNSGEASIEIFGGSNGSKYLEFFTNDSDYIKSSNIRIRPSIFLIQNYGDTYWSQLALDNGNYKFRRVKLSGGNTYEVAIPDFNVATNIFFPIKTISGSYNIVVEPSSTYLVSTLPAGQLGDRAVVTDATSPTYLGVAIGGGSTVVPVWHNGTTWVTN